MYHLFDAKYRLGELRGASTTGATLLRRTESPILLTAPHSVTQCRNGREKLAEFWTGAFAETIAELLGANVLTSLSPRIENENAASRDPFLDVLQLMLSTDSMSLVIDVHGLHARHEIDINIGAAGMPHASNVVAIAETLASSFKVAVDHPYSGGSGIAGMINRKEPRAISALQLELGPRLRCDTVDGRELRMVADAIRCFAR